MKALAQGGRDSNRDGAAGQSERKVEEVSRWCGSDGKPGLGLKGITLLG